MFLDPPKITVGPNDQKVVEVNIVKIVEHYITWSQGDAS